MDWARIDAEVAEVMARIDESVAERMARLEAAEAASQRRLDQIFHPDQPHIDKPGEAWSGGLSGHGGGDMCVFYSDC